ncbi:hypothetical protein CMO93_01315 [Candidatus Woesearchaeota archaeon]|nr:hypothetical protein [Candidatus Woesearchaeota archaeon]|tara:strand:+ start:5008 stop:5214 length:207 start_codon:yes stop_codon:yes gene_type:complete
MSKYKNQILKILSKDEIKSTNEILKELEKSSKRVINWHALYRVLMDLESENKIERLKAKAGFFWKKKN